MPKRDINPLDYFLPPGQMMALVAAFYLNDDAHILASPLSPEFIPFLIDRGFVDRDGLTLEGQDWAYKAMYCNSQRMEARKANAGAVA